MLIRVEIPIDAPGIDALLRRSFESDAEAKLVHDLRCRWPGTESAFLVHRLADDALNGVTGLVEYHDHFNRF